MCCTNYLYNLTIYAPPDMDFGSSGGFTRSDVELKRVHGYACDLIAVPFVELLFVCERVVYYSDP